ncbi:hypothetical protein MMC12_007651 [Toensbergia leucococca]|nr:hypothetical protein [Toensbergia leucococca]
MSTHSGSLAVGELIGAAGFITAVVAGSMALVRPFKVAKKSFVRDVCFFIVAASFSMVFLADGYLHLWECAAMVAFYIFYVITVVVWHWYLGQRRRRQEREVAARSHFYASGIEGPERAEESDDDEDAPAGDVRGIMRVSSMDDFATLERGGSPVLRALDEEDRDRLLAEISSNMRVSRPLRGERRNTGNPIRPSLVGALEFRAVLSSLQKSRTLQNIPINLRRYSDDPSYIAVQQQYQSSIVSDPTLHGDVVDAHDLVTNDSSRLSVDPDRIGAANRVRAVSANDAAGLQIDSNTLQRTTVPQIDLLSASPPDISSSILSESVANGIVASPASTPSLSPKLSVSPPTNELGFLDPSPMTGSRKERGSSPNLLAPPLDGLLGFRGHQQPSLASHHDEPSGFKVPKIHFSRSPANQASSPLSPFPAYHDDPHFPTLSRPPSIRLPPPSAGSESMYHQNTQDGSEGRPIRSWPYEVLPPPRILVSTLFPTLFSWNDKNIWEKFLGIVAAPSVFLLAITLPVVEAEKGDEIPEPIVPDSGVLSPSGTRSRSHLRNVPVLPPESPIFEPVETENVGFEQPSPNIGQHGNHGLGSPAIRRKDKNIVHVLDYENRDRMSQGKDSSNADYSPSSPKEWNRWLVSTQAFTAPFFMVLIIWANSDPTFSARNLLFPTLYALIASLVVFAIILLTTTDSKPPRHRYLLCFVGFIVSIAWISTIANEVVGVLKALGVILGISDAILGLTIFAVGNSLGDLIADITVAKLGYPVMALSACFGGPMLNILLGIGLGGLYMTIRDGNVRHSRHPKKLMKYKPYQIEVGETLIISGISLLVTLLGLLVVVPMNGWRMDRKIGWGLIVLWIVSTLGNLAVEITGWGGDLS